MNRHQKRLLTCVLLVGLLSLNGVYAAEASSASPSTPASDSQALPSAAAPSATPLPPGLPACHYPQADDGKPIKVAASLQQSASVKTVGLAAGVTSGASPASNGRDASDEMSKAILLAGAAFLVVAALTVGVKKRRGKRR